MEAVTISWNWQIIAIISFTYLLTIFSTYILFKFNRSHSALQEKVKTMNLEFEKTLLTSQVEMQEKAFKDISREIHDQIGHTLSFAKLQLVTMPLHEPEVVQERVNSSVENISRVMDDLRDLTTTLNPEFIKKNGLDTER